MTGLTQVPNELVLIPVLVLAVAGYWWWFIREVRQLPREVMWRVILSMREVERSMRDLGIAANKTAETLRDPRVIEMLRHAD